MVCARGLDQLFSILFKLRVRSSVHAGIVNKGLPAEWSSVLC